MITLPLNLEYQIARRLPSDINEHLELLKSLADSVEHVTEMGTCLLYTSPSPRDGLLSRMPSSA